MLVLSRKLGESIEIGGQKIVVRVLGIKRSKVQLGIDAPPEIAIHRSETTLPEEDDNRGDRRNCLNNARKDLSRPDRAAAQSNPRSDRKSTEARTISDQLHPIDSERIFRYTCANEIHLKNRCSENYL